MTCGDELHPERARKYNYCMSPECQEKNLKGLTMVAVGVNKSAEQYLLLDDETRDDLARGKYHDQRRAAFGTSAGGTPAEGAPARSVRPSVPAPAIRPAPVKPVRSRPISSRRRATPRPASSTRLSRAIGNDQVARPELDACSGTGAPSDALNSQCRCV